MANTVKVELTYEELKVLRRALGSRSLVLDERIERYANEEDKMGEAMKEQDCVDRLYVDFYNAMAKIKEV